MQEYALYQYQFWHQWKIKRKRPWSQGQWKFQALELFCYCLKNQTPNLSFSSEMFTYLLAWETDYFHLPDVLVVNLWKRVLVKCKIGYQYNCNTPLKIDSKMMPWDSLSLSSLIFRSHVFSLAGLRSSFFFPSSNKFSAEQVWPWTLSLSPWVWLSAFHGFTQIQWIKAQYEKECPKRSKIHYMVFPNYTAGCRGVVNAVKTICICRCRLWWRCATWKYYKKTYQELQLVLQFSLHWKPSAKLKNLYCKKTSGVHKEEKCWEGQLESGRDYCKLLRHTCVWWWKLPQYQL